MIIFILHFLPFAQKSHLIFCFLCDYLHNQKDCKGDITLAVFYIHLFLPLSGRNFFSSGSRLGNDGILADIGTGLLGNQGAFFQGTGILGIKAAFIIPVLSLIIGKEIGVLLK